MSRMRSELEKARAELLDLGLRNTLLNFRRLRTRGVEVVDELPDEVFRLLVRQERPMSFLPAPEQSVGEEKPRGSGDLLAEWLEAHQSLSPRWPGPCGSRIAGRRAAGGRRGPGGMERLDGGAVPGACPIPRHLSAPSHRALLVGWEE
jgi:hypothetical protein